VVQARGDIFTLPAEKGEVRNITRTPGVRERLPSFAPNGKWVAYVSDQTGEYEVYLKAPDGSGDEVKVTTGLHGYPFGLLWSPDSKKLLVYDQTFAFYYIDIEDKKLKRIDEDDWGDLSDFSWSKDSKWVAYSKNGDNQRSSIYFYSIDEGKSHKVTGDLYNDYNPVFGPDGKYLYFFTDRMTNFQFNSFEFDINYAYPTNLVAATLRKDVPSLLAPESDEVEVKEDDEEKEDKEENKEEVDKKEEKETEKKDDEKDDDEEKDKDLEIDFDGFEDRIIGLPIGMGNYFGLAALEDKILFADVPKFTISTSNEGPNTFTLKYYDIKERKTETVIAGIIGFAVSADGKKILYGAPGMTGIIDAGKGKKVGDGKLATKDITIKVDPLTEWTQMFHEAWRFERDFFYVSNMHGLDWKKMKKRYEVFLPHLASRSDLNYIIGEMIAELSVGHSYVGGGDYTGVRGAGVATLGCDFEIDQKNNRYKISKIYRGRNWDPSFISPLWQPGIDVNEGDYLLEINGVDLKYPTNPYELLETLAGKQTSIKVSADPKGEESEEFTVIPVT
ncbi:MAG: PDZ domain-containing protein, partial [Candidatus Krumholzibacteria bacterium]|nr:PDZ domain-containing protein [Candidatus Krumholzibacteria bacterium]